MTEGPELEEFRRELDALGQEEPLSLYRNGDEIRLAELTRAEVASLIAGRGAGYYFLIAAAGLNRTSLKASLNLPEASIVAPRERPAFAIKRLLPIRTSFRATAAQAVVLRKSDLGRKRSSGIESLFRERLASEGVPLLMSPPIRRVPSLLVRERKPDGVYPDPRSDLPPRVYLEVKNVGRVSDDIQKRLYELAEASLEMKSLYGSMKLFGQGLTTPSRLLVEDSPERIQILRNLRSQIVVSLPVVVGLFLCAKAAAERYRPGAEAFVDRIFFQEEVEECIAFLRDACNA